MPLNWETLVQNITAGTCVPFVGAGACKPVLPLGAELSDELLLRAKVGKPYPFKLDGNLAKVSQYVAAVRNDALATKRDVSAIIADKTNAIADSSIPAILSTLAQLKLPVYLTTNYDNLLERALVNAGANPCSEICRWTQDLLDEVDSRFDSGTFKPDAANPVVFHLHGVVDRPESIVVTEDDYLDFLLNVAREVDTSPATSAQKTILPLPLRTAIRKRPLFFIGYSLTDINFLYILRGLVRKRPMSSRVQSVAVQLNPETLPTAEALEDYQDRVEQYFRWTFDVEVLWSKAQELAVRLQQEFAARPAASGALG